MSQQQQLLSVSNQNLSELGKRVQVPNYDRSKLQPLVVHIGMGNFHRAHFAYYTDKLLKDNPQWGIVGVGLMPQDAKMKEALQTQDHLYTLMVRTEQKSELAIIGAICDYIFAPDDPQKVIQAIAGEKTKIVSLTVTEKGYSQNPVTGLLNFQNEGIQNDLKNIQNPSTTIGYLVAGLNQRFQKNMPPMTILNCDNIQANGTLLKKLLLQFSDVFNKELSAYIEKNITFPNSMVDRITPATQQDDLKYLSDNYGIVDKFPVKTEDFVQWIIEDHFAAERPPWEKYGENVMVVKEVMPFELMKLRLLNGSHVSLSFFSTLLGYAKVDVAMKDQLIRKYVEDYLDEVTPTVPTVPIDLVAYKKKLVERYSNSAIGDQVPRLAMDAQQKYSEWISPCIKILLKDNKKVDCIAMSLGSWARYMNGKNEQGGEIKINDPAKDALLPLAQQITKENNYNPKQFLAATFSSEITENEQFVEKVRKVIQELYEIGTKQYLSKFYA